MILLRCSWHRRYFGYPLLYGIASWRGLRAEFSDGMCHACSHRWRAELRGEAMDLLPALVPGWFVRGGIALALLAAVVLSARSVDRGTRATPTREAARSASVERVHRERPVSTERARPGGAPRALDDRVGRVAAAAPNAGAAASPGARRSSPQNARAAAARARDPERSERAQIDSSRIARNVHVPAPNAGESAGAASAPVSNSRATLRNPHAPVPSARAAEAPSVFAGALPARHDRPAAGPNVRPSVVMSDPCVSLGAGVPPTACRARVASIATTPVTDVQAP